MKMKISEVTDKTYFLELVSYNFGQANYIVYECERQKIRCLLHNNRIYLASRSKIDQLKEIVQKSCQFLSMEDPKLKHPCQVYYYESKLLGVVTKTDEGDLKAFVKENDYKLFIYFVYVKKIPKPQHTTLFNTQREVLLQIDSVNDSQ